MKKLSKVLLVGAVSVMLFGTSAFAGIDFERYNLVVGRFNGIIDTDYQIKNTTGTDGYIISEFVGGDYVVDARMNSPRGSGYWTRNVTDNETRKLDATSAHTKGIKIRAQFSNDWNTPVVVQVRGQFMSN